MLGIGTCGSPLQYIKFLAALQAWGDKDADGNLAEARRRMLGQCLRVLKGMLGTT